MQPPIPFASEPSESATASAEAGKLLSATAAAVQFEAAASAALVAVLMRRRPAIAATLKYLEDK